MQSRREIFGLLLRKAELRQVRPLTLLDMAVSGKATQCQRTSMVKQEHLPHIRRPSHCLPPGLQSTADDSDDAKEVVKIPACVYLSMKKPRCQLLQQRRGAPFPPFIICLLNYLLLFVRRRSVGVRPHLRMHVRLAKPQSLIC